MSEDRGEINEDEEEEEELDEYDDSIPVFEEYGWTGLGPIYAPPGMDPLELLPDLEPEEKAPPNVYVDPEDGEFYYPYELGPDDEPIPEFDPDLSEERPADPVPFDLFEPPPVSEPEEPDEDISPNVYVDPREGGFFYPYELLPDDEPIPEFDPDPNEKPPFEPIPWVKETPEEEKEPNSPEEPSNPQSPTFETGPLLLEPLVEEEPEEPIDEFEEPDELVPLEEPQPLELDQPLSNEFDPNYETDMPLEIDSDENLDEIPIEPEFDELELLEEEEVNEYFSRFDEQSNLQLSEEVEEKSEPLEQISDKPLEEVEEPEIDVEETEEPSLTFQKETLDKITKVYSNGEIEIEESLPKAKGRLPINLRLWLEMNKHVKDSYIEVLIDYIYESEKGEKTTVRKVKAKIFLTPEGIVIQLPEDEKGDLVRELLKRKGRIKARFPNLLPADIETTNKMELRKRLKAFLSISNLSLSELGNIKKTAKQNKKILLYESLKTSRGSGYKIYLDGSISFHTTPTKSYGLRIPSDTKKWIKLPENEKDKIIAIADFFYLNSQSIIILIKDVEIEIFYKQLSKDRKNKGVFVRPIGHGINENKIRNLMKDSIKLTCELDLFSNNIEITDDFEKMQKMMQSHYMSKNSKISELVVSGQKQDTLYEIYQRRDGQIFLRIKGRMTGSGEVHLPDSLKSYISDWLMNEEMVVCSRDRSKPIIKKFKLSKKKNGRITKIIAFPYYGNPINVELLLTNENWKLSKEALKVKSLRKLLQEAFFEIEMLRTDISEIGRHKNLEFEDKLFELLKQVFGKYNIIMRETELTSKHIEKENRFGEKHIFDFIVVMKSKSKSRTKILLFELKTTEKTPSMILKNDIGELLHYKRKLGNNERIIPIIIYPLLRRNLRLEKYRNLAESIGVKILYKEDFDKIKNDPKSLLEIIFAQQVIEIERSNYNNQILYSEISVLQKYKELLEEIFQYKSRIVGIKNIEETVNSFENEIKELLENEGFEVIRNLDIEIFGIKNEIDLVAIRDREVLIVECSDGQNLKNKRDIENRIMRKINRIELYKNLFNAHKGRVYVKLDKYSKEMKDKYSNTDWIKDIKVIIEEKEEEN